MTGWLNQLKQGLQHVFGNISPTPCRSRSTVYSMIPIAFSNLEPRQLLAGEFTDLGALGISGISVSDADWGDSDNDGDLDVLVSGTASNQPVTRLYRNDGTSFTNVAPAQFGIHGDVAWGDSDNDGDLDILVVGTNSSQEDVGTVYRNNGNNTFTDLQIDLPAILVRFGTTIEWGDADQDGDLDLLLAGTYTDNDTSSVAFYRNDGGNRFTSSWLVGISSVSNGDLDWGDYDNDGDLDLLMTGRHQSDVYITELFRNDGMLSFTRIDAGLEPTPFGSVSWGDYDNDGDLDVLSSGLQNGFLAPRVKVYRNAGSDTFNEVFQDVPSSGFNSATWGDYDNDGDLDIIDGGRLHRNDGNNFFTSLNVGVSGAVSWGDMDGDGDLDLLRSDGHFYRNNTTIANTPAAAPSALFATAATSTSITFSWTAATDTQTPAAGLSYNLRVGTTPGGSNVFATMANTTTGKRRLTDGGPIQGTSYTLKGLIAGQTYYWSVQAVDTAFTGGAFATEQSVTIPFVNTAPVIAGAVASQQVNDTATISPFTTVTVIDPDTQMVAASVRLVSGVVRGDFTTASATGWTRTVIGNDIQYFRSFPAAPNNGANVQAALRTLVFQPRANAITPNTTEATRFNITVTDSVAPPAVNTITTVVTKSVNNSPTITGANNTVAVNDNATVNPFPTLTVTDVDMQEMLISVTILNGTVRGDFTPASVANWPVRQVIGNNITYKRYFSPQASVGMAAQAAFRALIFQPRQNAIKPGTTERTDFQVTVSDGVAAAVSNSGTRVTTTSVNNAPAIAGAVANQTMNDNQTKAVFSTLTVTDPDTQDMLVQVTITKGLFRGDFTTASRTGWARSFSGFNIVYSRYFSPASNIGATTQAAIRALIYQPRTNIPVGTTESTSFTVSVNDGLASTKNSATSVVTTGVAPRAGAEMPATAVRISEQDTTFVTVPTTVPPQNKSLARLLRKTSR